MEGSQLQDTAKECWPVLVVLVLRLKDNVRATHLGGDLVVCHRMPPYGMGADTGESSCGETSRAVSIANVLELYVK